MYELDHEALVSALLPAALDAGAALLRHREAGVTTEHKADRTPVTAADRESEAIVLAALARAAAGVPVIAEEQVAAGHIPAFGREAFLVDALDGTREFINGSPDFTVNVALVGDGVPVFGIVFAPAAGRLFASFGPDRAMQARLDPARLRQGGAAAAAGLAFEAIHTVEPDAGAVRVLTSHSHLSPATVEFLTGFEIGSQRGIGSSLKFGLIAAAEADLYPRFGPTSEWDTAAGHAVLLAAGGAVTTADGAALRYLTRPADFLNPAFIAWGRTGWHRPA